ncbi:tetratricopeptide repeat protein [Vibrio sp. SCSIO 43140]|uniref:tetratricopeptide repeat protein n=1 Tax=Vibrio sp. SCSIO 43140 TaxID=2819100 RepID=UPI0020759A9F|nr:tetratricopeptide repeat protein [Vibrio sp. SCSIO 43140]USD61781.1 tetratricopeptide repeat protein [Vibrio sp. SCSIO 43140]
MKGFKKAPLLLFASLLIGCTSTSDKPSYDTSLYSGRPIDTLTQDPPPKSEVEALQRGDAALAADNIDLALYEYIRSLSFQPTNYKDKTLFTIGQIHLSRNNNELAEDAFLMSIKANPNNYMSLQQLGVIYTKLGDSEEGETYFYRSINADQVRQNSRVTLNAKNLENNDLSSLVVDSESPANAYMGLGILLDVKGQYSAARELYNKANLADPKLIKVFINQGYSYYMSGDYYKAESSTQRALKREPSNQRAQNNLALIYIGMGEENKALNMFSRHMERHEALNNVGYFLMLKGKPDRAIPYFKQAIDAKPSYYKLANDNLERALSEVRAKEVIVTSN